MIKVSVRGVDQLKKFFSELTPAARKEAVKAVSTYLLGDERHGLKHYAPPFVGHKRTYKLREHWKSSVQGAGYGMKLYNDVVSKYGREYAKWVQGDGTQARHVRRRGWRTMSEVISTNIQGAMKKANEAVNKWLKGRGMM